MFLRLKSVRLALWITALVAVIVFRVWSDWAASRSGSEVLHMRVATVEEWAQSIETLAESRCAKEVIWRFRLKEELCEAHGRLAWWWDGGRERVSYIAASDEDAQRAYLWLRAALAHGEGMDLLPRAWIENGHGDPDLFKRMEEEAQREGPQIPPMLPDGWTLLRPPGSSL